MFMVFPVSFVNQKGPIYLNSYARLHPPLVPGGAVTSYVVLGGISILLCLWQAWEGSVDRRPVRMFGSQVLAALCVGGVVVSITSPFGN